MICSNSNPLSAILAKAIDIIRESAIALLCQLDLKSSFNKGVMLMPSNGRNEGNDGGGNIVNSAAFIRSRIFKYLCTIQTGNDPCRILFRLSRYGMLCKTNGINATCLPQLVSL